MSTARSGDDDGNVLINPTHELGDSSHALVETSNTKVIWINGMFVMKE